MDLEDAFRIVLDLARGNAVDEDEAAEEPELAEAAKEHQAAIERVERFVANIKIEG